MTLWASDAMRSASMLEHKMTPDAWYGDSSVGRSSVGRAATASSPLHHALPFFGGSMVSVHKPLRIGTDLSAPVEVT